MMKRILNLAIREPKYFLNQLRLRILHKANLKLSPFVSNYSYCLKKLWIPLTYRCNLRCKMCAQWGDLGRSFGFSPEKITEELSLEKLKNLIDEVSIYQPNIMLIGGEPLLYSNWKELANYIKKKNLRCELTTNGVLLEKFAEEIINLIDNLNISFDGPPEINDEIRGIKGISEKILQGLKKIDELKKSLKKDRPYLNICCTISEENYHSLFDLAENMDSYKIHFNLILFQHLEFTTEEILKENKKVWQKEFKSDSNFWRANLRELKNFSIDKLQEQILRIKKRNYKNIDFVLFDPEFSYEELKKFYSTPSSPPKRFLQKCFAPYQEVFVYPDGVVWTCPGLVMGNIKEEKFINIWNGENYRKLRRWLNKEKTFPICSRCANHWHNWSG